MSQPTGDNVSIRAYFDRIDASNQEAISEARRLAEKAALEAREHIQNIFEEHRHAHVQKHADDSVALTRAREHLAAIFEEHRRSHDQKHADDEKALQAAHVALNVRLGMLNELRGEVIEDRVHYVRQETFEARVTMNGSRIERLEEFRNRADSLYQSLETQRTLEEGWNRWRDDVSKQLAQLPSPETIDTQLKTVESRFKALEDFRSRALGFGTLVALLSGAVGAAVARMFG